MVLLKGGNRPSRLVAHFAADNSAGVAARGELALDCGHELRRGLPPQRRPTGGHRWLGRWRRRVGDVDWPIRQWHPWRPCRGQQGAVTLLLQIECVIGDEAGQAEKGQKHKACRHDAHRWWAESIGFLLESPPRVPQMQSSLWKLKS